MSYGIYIGKGLTADGSVLLGGSGDEPSSHWLVVQPRRRHEENATISVGGTERATIPAQRIEIPQARQTYKYITHYYSEYEGFVGPLTNGGLNECGVAARDIWSPSRKELVEMTPRPQRGLTYSDLSRIVMQRATSARHAVEIVGSLIDAYGYCTYGGNSHLFADADEGWILIEMAGGVGLWAAERLKEREVRFSYPGYILEVPQDYRDHPDFAGSDNLISFAVAQGWYDPNLSGAFNVNKVYGQGQGRDRRFRGDTSIAEFEDAILARAGAITVQDMMRFVRDPRISLDTTGYGQVVRLHRDTDTDLQVLWAAPTASVTAPFIPYYMGIDKVPPEFGWHRYLSSGEAARFQDPNYTAQEATEFAFRLFKRLFYHVAERPAKFLPEVVEALTAFEKGMLDDEEVVTRTARVLQRAGESGLAQTYLTEYCRARSMDALHLGRALLGNVEARTKVLYGIRTPDGVDGVDRVHCYYPEYFED